MKNRGFTLIEMVVVLAVIAILAAILVPTIEKNIKDAKITRASNEAQVIAAAMTSFYKDVGRWPNLTTGTDPSTTVNLLVTNVGNEVLPTTSQWRTDVTTNYSTFEDQLISNTPGYTTVGEIAWKGPYLTTIKPDPWGYKYVCNVQYTWDFTTGDYAVFVLSAGPDSNVDTSWTQSIATAALGNDDVGARVR